VKLGQYVGELRSDYTAAHCHLQFQLSAVSVRNILRRDVGTWERGNVGHARSGAQFREDNVCCCSQDLFRFSQRALISADVIHLRSLNETRHQGREEASL
jgi:hypothetical protein